MNIQLDEETQRLLQERVEAGKYPSIAEAVQLGVRLLLEQEEREEELARLRAEVQKGVDDIEAGRYSIYNREEFMEDARRKLGAAS